MFPDISLPSVNPADLYAELLIGTGGAVFALIFAWCLKALRNFLLQRKYPISGEYLSFFEDIEGGKKIKRSSSATIYQSGLNVKIEDTLPDLRTWNLHGKIIGGEHICGAYSADAIYDTGVGSFYLNIERNRLDGMWSGFDHKNKIINFGRYWFIRKADVAIREPVEPPTEAILDLTSRAFGPNYFQDIRPHLGTDESFALSATVDSAFAGFAFGYMVPEGQVQSVLKCKADRIPNDLAHADHSGKVGIIKTIAVKSDFRSQGIGHKLFKASEARLLKLGASCIIIPAWETGGKIAIESIAKSLNYKPFFAHDTYWKTECEKGDFKCPKFDDQCMCSAAFYKKSNFDIPG